MLGIFLIYTFASTLYNAKALKNIHEIKKRDGYYFDPSDIQFHDNKSITKVTFFCFLAGILGGIVGVAGGIITSPLFL